MSRGVLAGFLVGFLLVSAVSTGVGAAPPNPELELSAESSTVEPGETATLNVTVKNNGTRPATGEFTLNSSSLPEGWNATQATFNGTVPQNESIKLTLNVSVPDTAPDSVRGMRIRLFDQNGIAASATIEFRVASSPVAGGGDDESRDEPGDRTGTGEEENESAPAVVGIMGDEEPSFWDKIDALIESLKPDWDSLLPDWLPFIGE